MTVYEMMNEVISTLGLENGWTIWFCSLCENEEEPTEYIKSGMDMALKFGRLEMLLNE